jgi:hypothetical protein
VLPWLHPGSNQLAVQAVNLSDRPNPAGLIGRVLVEFTEGEPILVRIDGSWKAAKEEQPGWTKAAHDETGWSEARELVPFGGGPWGMLRGMLTVSPIAAADPFEAECELPADVDLARVRISLEMEDPEPEPAARVSVNGKYAGGFIGRPCRVEVTPFLVKGTNTIRIEPFVPRAARLVLERS